MSSLRRVPLPPYAAGTRIRRDALRKYPSTVDAATAAIVIFDARYFYLLPVDPVLTERFGIALRFSLLPTCKYINVKTRNVLYWEKKNKFAMRFLWWEQQLKKKIKNTRNGTKSICTEKKIN